MSADKSPPVVRLGAGATAAMAVWFGSVIGFGELAVLGYDKFVAQKLVFTTWHVLWLAPLANILYCALAGALLLLAGGGRASLFALLVAFLWLAVLCWGLMFGALHWLAVLFLGLVIAVKLGQALARRGEGLVAFVRGSAFLLGAVVLALVGFTVGSDWWRERSALGGLPAAPAGRPNVVFVTLDTVRAQELSLYGHERPTTPRLAAIAAQGVVFDRAIAPAPWTLPTHASLFTGRFHHELSVDWMAPLNAEPATLAETMASHGYATAGFVANLNYCAAEVGLARGFAHYEDYPLSFGQLVLCSSLGRAITNSVPLRELLGYHENLNRKLADDLNDSFFAWLDDQATDDRPFFAFLNYYDAHQPYLPPGDFAGKFGPVAPRTGFRYDTNLIEIHDWTVLSPEQIQMERDSYDAAIAYLDDRLGRLVDELERRGLLSNTVLVFVGDHGEQFGAHELYNHGNSLYTQNVRVPLVIRAPGGRTPAGSRVATAVSLRDLAATVVDLAGLPPAAGLGGATLAPAWEDPAAFAERPNLILSEVFNIEPGKRFGRMVSLVSGQLHYIVNGYGSEKTSEELYNLDSDPLETFDMTVSKQGREYAGVYRAALDQNLGGK